MSDAIVVVNAGSSSGKFSLFVEDHADLVLDIHGQIEGLYTAPHFVANRRDGAKRVEKVWSNSTLGHDGALHYLMEYLGGQLAGSRLVGIGHRVVHGGLDYADAIAVDAHALSALERLTPLAPLHQPHNLAPIRAPLESTPACLRLPASTRLPPHQPDIAQRFAILSDHPGRAPVRLHGLSYEYIGLGAALHDPRAAQGKTVVLHPRQRGKMCALKAAGASRALWIHRAGRLPMGTQRCPRSRRDPLHDDQCGMDARVSRRCSTTSPGCSVSGISSDMRTLLPESRARRRRLYCYRIASSDRSAQRSTGSMRLCSRAASGRTQRISGNACAATQDGLAELTPANARGGPRIGGGRVEAWALTNEELMIARHTDA
jgi:acetate kinase